MDKPINVLSAANCMIEKSQFSVTNLKLNKLMYYLYGLGIANGLEFNEGPQAWRYGPVFPTVYHTFKIYGVSRIEKIAEGFKAASEKLISYIDVVYEQFGSYQEWWLVQRTHAKGGPWDKIYNENELYTDIPDDLIKNYFIDHLLTN